MKKFLTAILSFIALSATASTALAGSFPKGSPEFHTDYKTAEKAAKAEGKPMLVVFSATWCGPCQANKKGVYPSTSVKPFHDDFVWVYLDVDQKKNGPLAQKFGVNGIPHIEFVKAGGKTIDQAVGGTSPRSFAKKLKSVLKKAS